MKRFSKATLAEYLVTRINSLGNRHNFSRTSGYAQVEGRMTATVVSYGEWDRMIRMMDEFELWKHVPADVSVDLMPIRWSKQKVRD